VDLAVRKNGDETFQYSPVVARHVGSTAIMVFAKDGAKIDGLETAGVGLGEWGMGNKGAVGVRLLYRDINSDSSTELTFVSAHLAAMEWMLERRNEDWKNIVRGLVFSSTSQERSGKATSLSAEDDQPLLQVSPHNAGIYKPTSHLFVSGDLNYRTSTRSPGKLDHRDSFPQPHHTETDSQHHSSLFENDQLTQELEAGRTLHGFVEAPITFPPTYKYNIPDQPYQIVDDEDLDKWSWAEHRWPSWTDRILYLPLPVWLRRVAPKADIVEGRYVALPLFATSDHRPVAMSFTVSILIPISQDVSQEYILSADDRKCSYPMRFRLLTFNGPTC
jgi:hypothetical protein